MTRPFASIMFTSADPPHTDHRINVAAVKAYTGGPVVVIPNPSSPVKPDLSPWDIRVKMLDGLFGHTPNVFVLRHPEDLRDEPVPGREPHGVFLERFLKGKLSKSLYGKLNFHLTGLIYGSDAAEKVLAHERKRSRLYHPALRGLILPRQTDTPESLFQLTQHIATSAPEGHPPTARILTWVYASKKGVHSTDIREAVGQQETAHAFLPRRVETLIRKSKLYL
jgi:nicotinic acid mononucleotide adenylyltransferase